MNRGNRRINVRAVELLQPGRDERVLDLGFGGGLGLDLLLDRTNHVVGVDRAADMVAAARAARADAVASGRLTLLEGDVYALPLADDSVDGIVTVNTVYFWPDLPSAFSELRRVLAPEGRLVIGIRDGAVMNNVDRTIFTVRTPAELQAELEQADFHAVRVESPDDHPVHFLVVQAGSGR